MTKVVVVSARWYAITAAAEYLARAFEKFPDVRVVKAGPTHGNFMPYKRDGIFVSEDYLVTPDILIPNTFSEVPISYVENELMAIGISKVDLWLDVHAGFRLTGKPKRLGGVRCIFLTDPHTHLSSSYEHSQDDYDLVFNPQLSYWLKIPDTKQKYLPYAADDWYRYKEFQKEYDVSLVGNLYNSRVEYFNEIRRRNYRTFFDVGIAKATAGDIYNRSIVGFNWSSMDDLVCRVFEVGYSDSVLITNRVSRIGEHFQDGVHFIGFDNLSQAIEATEYVLKTPSIWSQIKSAMHSEIQTKHRWIHRAEQIFREVNL